MGAPAVIKATFSDYRRVRGRKVGQLVFEVPLEQLHEAIAGLGGEPSVANDTWVALARLEDEFLVEQAPPALPAPKGKRQFKDMPAAQQAALICKEPPFWTWLREMRNYDCTNESEATDYVRAFCEVESRAELKPGSKAESRWQFLASAYEGWKHAAEAGA